MRPDAHRECRRSFISSRCSHEVQSRSRTEQAKNDERSQIESGGRKCTNGFNFRDYRRSLARKRALENVAGFAGAKPMSRTAATTFMRWPGVRI